MFDLIKYVIVPSNLITVFLIAGIITFFFQRIRKFAIYLVGASALIYIIFASGPVSYWLIISLESRYPALNSFEKIEKFDTIVVLPGHADPDPYFPLTSTVNSSTAFRLIEALRIWRLFPDSTILITGQKDVPELMGKVLYALGLPDNRMSIETESTSTYENAVILQKKLGDRPFILITSAGHMPRAMAVFKKLGMNPIPAPTDYMAGSNFLATQYLPSPSHLMYSDLAIHEYIGILWYKLTGRL
jgi:uncharacterized SAM-binding protein YcdF (DUF218 family)